MADNKKYYYFRLTENFFDSESMIVLESLPDGYLYSNILLKLYAKSLKGNGRLMFNDRIPYNPTILAQITRHNVGVVEKALQILRDLELIEILDNGAIYMMDIQNFIGESSTEADRKREYRQRVEQERILSMVEKTNVGQMSRQMSDKCPQCISETLENSGITEFEDKCPDKSPPEIEKEIEIKKELEIREREESKDSAAGAMPPIPYDVIVNLYNSICASLPRIKRLSDTRKKAIKARLKNYNVDDFQQLFEMAEGSDFLKGKNNRDWVATFDWLIKDSNMAKVLDGNYVDRNKQDTNKELEDWGDENSEINDWMNERLKKEDEI